MEFPRLPRAAGEREARHGAGDENETASASHGVLSFLSSRSHPRDSITIQQGVDLRLPTAWAGGELVPSSPIICTPMRSLRRAGSSNERTSIPRSLRETKT